MLADKQFYKGLKNALYPWTDIITEESKDGKITVRLWGRTYVVDKTLFFSEITSQNKPVLAQPMKIHGRENGRILKLQLLTVL